MTQPLGHRLFPGNACFGCGQHNPTSLGLEVRRDPGDPAGVLGSFRPTERTAGFPGIAHGGALYTVLDCLATWTVSLLRPEPAALWLLRSAEMTYHRPAPVDGLLSLRGAILEEGAPWSAVLVSAQARDADGGLVAEGRFKEIPITEERFAQVTGGAALPPAWAEFLANVRTSD